MFLGITKLPNPSLQENGMSKNRLDAARSCSLCEWRTSFCMGHTTEKLRGFLRFRLSLLHSVSYFFFLYRSPSSFLYTVFDAISVSGQALLESLWFSTACAAVTVHKNPIFCLYQQNKSSESKVKLRQAGNRYRRVFEATKLAYAEKTKQKSIKSL